ncbi:MAG: methyltransferase domain-containing protein [Nitrospirae bacterium]|nr:methyltransferase domain-containing protein [Nitrospirota bacterium]
MSIELPSREDVRNFYARAAKRPDSSLCCPTAYSKEDIEHIPEGVFEVSYGCGSPVTKGGLMPGETVVDLGSGGGIDCFIAARMVGPRGKVIGIDMTDEMLARARKGVGEVSDRLGYDIVEFKKGLLEEIPLENSVADIVSSNCVINLSTDKKKVFEEIFRILKDGGRFVISDIVSGLDVPHEMKIDKKLWGECISGAIREDELFKVCKESGFYGLEILDRYLYRDIEGIGFFSVTVRGYKFNKGKDCVYEGQHAIYQGPFLSATDDEGHIFYRGVPAEVCTDTAKKLLNAPYADKFILIDPKNGDAGRCVPGCC